MVSVISTIKHTGINLSTVTYDDAPTLNLTTNVPTDSSTSVVLNVPDLLALRGLPKEKLEAPTAAKFRPEKIGF